jgi:propanol-preferring alcohol dehydrogenase
MQAMVLHRIGQPLEFETLADPEPGPHEISLRVGACGVCRTDFHLVDGELPDVRPPIIPGHELSDASIIGC